MIFYPNIYLNNVKDIKIELLKENDIKGLLLDVDNTLIDFDLKILEGAKEWCEGLRKKGIKLCILSNTNKIEKVKKVAKELDLPYINFAKKPFKKGFKRAIELLKLDAKNIAAVGDQVMTDVLRRKQNGNVYNSYKTTWKKRYIYNKSKKTFREFNNKRIFEKGKKRKREIKMYFNDVHILYYVAVAILGGVIGQFVDYCNRCFIKEQKIFSKESLWKYKRIMLPNYLLIAVTAIGYIALLYKFGFQPEFSDNLDLIKYMILLPMLLCAFVVDLKEQIIPNRLNLLMFEIGLVFVFLYGFTNINIALNMLIGMVAGGGIFLIITLLGGLIAGKEAMGMGDVKLMGALGLYFGLQNIVVVSVLAFLIGAIGSIIFMIISKKNANTYIPFGPFIVISSVITIFVPFNILFTILMKIFTLGMY